MRPLSKHWANRVGFIVLGLTNNFAYVIMLSAAYDLLNQSSTSQQQHSLEPSQQQLPPQPQLQQPQPQQPSENFNFSNSSTTFNESSLNLVAATSPLATGDTSSNYTAQPPPPAGKYCNEHSTSTILLADTLPSLTTKLLYPFLLVGLPTPYKAIGTALLTTAAFVITGSTTDQVLIFTGVVCASFSSGLGESTYISSTHLYGDVSLAGWSIGTGGAGLFGSMAYALLRMVLSIRTIMFTMLIIPVAMMYAFFCIIKPLSGADNEEQISSRTKRRQQATSSKLHKKAKSQPVDDDDEADADADAQVSDVSTISATIALADQNQPIRDLSVAVRHYGATNDAGDHTECKNISNSTTLDHDDAAAGIRISSSPSTRRVEFCAPFNLSAKLRCLPSLAKYFLPLLLVYFAEYFINQGLLELIYYPEVTFLDHAAQYRWFQVSYQLGVMISRSSLDFLQIKNIWAMSLLQALNALLFLAQASKLIHIASFYIIVALIIYEGLLGGFTYVNTFYRIKKEVSSESQEFCMSTVTIADSLGIVMAGLVALPVHNALCKLYE